SRRSLVLLLSLRHVSAPTALYPLSLHDALPIFFPTAARQDDRNSSSKDRPARSAATSGEPVFPCGARDRPPSRTRRVRRRSRCLDRKSTRLNSSHVKISYAVFCLKKKNKTSV